ncbi:unnamed protein product [Prorocentrum cordatum]|uniref:Ion transport domain-containing protein n=1 Tax=Prorocentrum cordatum TaxID=2364126 RepID=A0ABN9W4H0_9DINO|nr:unnamed protein product [Polarella glacialis]
MRPLASRDGPFARFVKSRRFTMGISCLIIMSSVLIGVETQIRSSLSSRGSDSEHVQSILLAANCIFTFLFTVEMFVVPLTSVFRWEFFVYERTWNCFDMAILILALIEIALELVLQSFPGRGRNLLDNGGTAKMLRLFRLTRLLRLVRTFRQLKPLRMLVHSIMFAARSVCWALLLLLMIVFAFGVVLTQAVTEHTEGGKRIDDEDLSLHPRSYLRPPRPPTILRLRIYWRTTATFIDQC